MRFGSIQFHHVTYPPWIRGLLKLSTNKHERFSSLPLLNKCNINPPRQSTDESAQISDSHSGAILLPREHLKMPKDMFGFHLKREGKTLLRSNRQELRLLFMILQCTDQSPTRENYLAHVPTVQNRETLDQLIRAEGERGTKEPRGVSQQKGYSSNIQERHCGWKRRTLLDCLLSEKSRTPIVKITLCSGRQGRVTFCSSSG